MIFGWTPSYALGMPAIRFFALVKEGRKQKEIERNLMLSELCTIASVALGDDKYYTHLKEGYRSRLSLLLGVLPEAAREHKVYESAPMNSGSQDAKQSLMHLFNAVKGLH